MKLQTNQQTIYLRYIAALTRNLDSGNVPTTTPSHGLPMPKLVLCKKWTRRCESLSFPETLINKQEERRIGLQGRPKGELFFFTELRDKCLTQLPKSSRTLQIKAHQCSKAKRSILNQRWKQRRDALVIAALSKDRWSYLRLQRPPLQGECILLHAPTWLIVARKRQLYLKRRGHPVTS